MARLALFAAAPLTLAAAIHLHQQHASGVGWLPQQQLITQAAAWVTRTVCPSPR